MSLRNKTFLGVAVIEMLLLAILIGSTLPVLHDANNAGMTRRAQLEGKLLALAAREAVIAHDLAALDSLVSDAMAAGRIDYLRILDAGGKVLAQQGETQLLSRPFHLGTRLDRVVGGVLAWSAPILAKGTVHGEVQLGIAVAPLHLALASMDRWTAVIVGAAMLLVTLFSWLFIRHLTRRLESMGKAIQYYETGDFSYRIPLRGNGELDKMARLLNHMAQQMGKSTELLQLKNREHLAAQLAAELALRELEQQKYVLDQHAVVTKCDIQGRVTYVNDKFCELSGYSREEFMGKDHFLLNSGYHPKGFFKNMYETIARGGIWHGEVCDRAKDGSLYWVDTTIATFKGENGKPQEYIAVRTDVSERRAAEAQIQDRNEQLAAIFDLSPDGFLTFDAAQHIKYVSPAFCRLTGLDEGEIVGLDETGFSECLAKICLPEASFSGIGALREMSKVAVGAPVQQRRQTIELVGSGRRVLEIALRISASKAVSQILYFRDITHETEINRLKSEFLSHAAHELRTPMASIYGFTELLMTHKFGDAERCDLLDTIFRQSKVMISIINELLDLARIEARRGKDFSIARVDLHALLHALVAGFKTPEGRPSPQLPSASKPFWVRADSKKLSQAVSNVISNAYKYSAAGSEVIVALDVRRDQPAAQGQGGGVGARLGIRITDQGIGMTPEQLERVCERFYRADHSGSIPGTGLGMSIVKEIVELHGGHLELASKLGVGTTVTLWLPGAKMPAELLPPGRSDPTSVHQEKIS